MNPSPATIDRLRSAIEGKDAATLIGMYAEDATLRIIDRDHPPARPQEMAGRDAIARYYEDVCGRAMTHRVDAGVADQRHLSFTESCAYPDGTQVFCAAMAELKDGLISRQVNVQAWDG